MQHLRLAKRPALEGFVVDERGAPLAAYHVCARQMEDNVKVPQSGETDATGRFRLEGGEDDYFEVSVSPKGCSMNGGLVTTATVRPSDGPLRIVVPSAILPTAAVALRLVRPDGSRSRTARSP